MKLEAGVRNELEKAIMEYLRDRNWKATKWDVFCFISGYEPETTAKEALEIIHWFINRGIEIQM